MERRQSGSRALSSRSQTVVLGLTEYLEGFKEGFTGKTKAQREEEKLERRREKLWRNDRLYYTQPPEETPEQKRRREQDEAWDELGPLTKADYRALYVEEPWQRLALANAYGEHNLLPY